MSTPPSSESFSDRRNECLAQLVPFLDEVRTGIQQTFFEVRALRVPNGDYKPRTLCGFFELGEGSDNRPLVNAVLQLVGSRSENQPEGVYMTINGVIPRSPGRAIDILSSARDICAIDIDVVKRIMMLIDIDPVRPPRTSATDSEKTYAKRVLDGIREDLDQRGFPAPMVIDSGNGYHLWYRIDLPRDDNGRVQRFLKALAQRHDTAEAKVDTSTFNPSRISKIPGTWARKGNSSPERPHRMARVLEVPK